MEEKIKNLAKNKEFKDLGMIFHDPQLLDAESSYYKIGHSIGFKHKSAIAFGFTEQMPDAIQVEFFPSEEVFTLPFSLTIDGCKKFSKSHLLPAKSFSEISEDMRLDEMVRCRKLKDRVPFSVNEARRISFFIGTGDYSENMALIENSAINNSFIYPLWVRLATGCNGRFSQIRTVYSNSLTTFERIEAYNQNFFFMHFEYFPYHWDNPLIHAAENSNWPFFKSLPQDFPMDCIGFIYHMQFSILENSKTLQEHLQNGREFVVYPLSLMCIDENGKTDMEVYKTIFYPFINYSNPIVRNFIAYESFSLCPELHEECKKIGLSNEVIEALKIK
jgi:hypothetical protein